MPRPEQLNYDSAGEQGTQQSGKKGIRKKRL